MHQGNESLQTHRELADKAEASRLAELRDFLQAGMKQRAEQDKAAQQALGGQLDALEAALRTSVEQTGNSMSAYFSMNLKID